MSACFERLSVYFLISVIFLAYRIAQVSDLSQNLDLGMFENLSSCCADRRCDLFRIGRAVLTERQYSKTCLERPPRGTQKYALSRQVVSGDRFSYIEM